MKKSSLTSRVIDVDPKMRVHRGNKIVSGGMLVELAAGKGRRASFREFGARTASEYAIEVGATPADDLFQVVGNLATMLLLETQPFRAKVAT